MKARGLVFWGIAWLALLFAGEAAFADSPSSLCKNYSFDGVVAAEDMGTYITLPFRVPDNITLIKVLYTYDEESAVIDIGIHDPHKFRGWSGTTRNEFTVSESREHTSDAYIAGEIPAGEWRIELGVADVKLTKEIEYQVRVALFDDDLGEPFVPPQRKDVVLSEEQRWYYGDLHCHSTHSDGAYPLDVTLDFAHSRGLDFIAATEHNSISHFSYIPEMQKRYDDMLILYGIEYTSYIGHANVFNYTDIIDFRAGTPGYDVNRVIDKVHEGGGYFSPNHPARFLGIGIPFLIDDIDWGRVDFYEVVNGRTRIADMVVNPLNLIALNNWDKMLQQGYRITAIGGSDDHSAGRNETAIRANIGTPTTVVYAEKLSPKAIWEGIAAGHVYILNEGKSHLSIEFTATGGGRTAMMGDRIEADEISYQIKVKNAAFKWLVIVENGFPLARPITSDDYEYSFTRETRKEGYIRLEVKSGPFHDIITNPIYYAPGA